MTLQAENSKDALLKAA